MEESQVKITQFIADAPLWQRKNLELFRKIVHSVAPNVEEDWKWSVPVFKVNGALVCAMSIFAGHTKFNFFHGASLDDPAKLLNSGLDSKTHRSINLKDGASVDASALSELVSSAFTLSK